jgi:DNA-binding NtrC family response regulator
MTSRCRVLVIDDDPDWLEVVVEILRDAGYEVASAVDGMQGRKMIDRFAPFVVMTDLQMPVMNGRQLLAQTHAADGRVPVIVVSGADVSDLPEAFRVIRKPSTPEGVLAAVGDAASHRADRLPLPKLWRAAAPHPTREARISVTPLSVVSGFLANALSYVRSMPRQHIAFAAVVLASSLLIRQLTKA